MFSVEAPAFVSVRTVFFCVTKAVPDDGTHLRRDFTTYEVANSVDSDDRPLALTR